jgi:hypothetical protein
MRCKAVLFFFLAALSCPQVPYAEPLQHPQNNVKTFNHAFAPGEKLTYSISWSKFLQAGVAVMEVKEELTSDGKRVYRLISSTKSVGVVEAFYPVRDTVESIMDPEELYSFSFNLKQSHGGKKRRRELAFDRRNKTVRIAIDDNKPETLTVPERAQDSLSSLYYMRTRQDFIVEKPILVDIVDGGKLWSVEMYTLGKERIRTPAGEFDTIKIKTYPKYEGVFIHKGEIFIWITDDERKIPVLMRSKIAIGSIVATLTNIQGGKEKP